MGNSDQSDSLLRRIHEIRGVSWEWRPDNPNGLSGLQAGVIAQEVKAAFPELVERAPHGYLTVDYPGLALRLGEAAIRLSDRLAHIDDRASALSDEQTKQGVSRVDDALRRLRDGEIDSKDFQALVGGLVEAVKAIDERLTEIERRLL